MSSLVVAGRPTNLHLPEDAHAIPVEGDLYDICGRVAEIGNQHGADLHVNLIVDPNRDEHAFVIFERGPDGHDRKVFRVAELDQRVLTRLHRIMAVPAASRMQAIMREVEAHEAEQKEAELEDLYERMGRPMWTQLEHDGFIETRPVSYPKAGVSGPKAAAARRARKGLVGS